ncbi:hypothetical protein HON52_00775 [Candidatus Uhrbacteria bacterium]|jgi:hypothetical protein|nr:hypothetical protein [Candidatus Uhrbacteria bacterium]
MIIALAVVYASKKPGQAFGELQKRTSTIITEGKNEVTAAGKVKTNTAVFTSFEIDKISRGEYFKVVASAKNTITNTMLKMITFCFRFNILIIT